jgi:hypothetical protein
MECSISFASFSRILSFKTVKEKKRSESRRRVGGNTILMGIFMGDERTIVIFKGNKNVGLIFFYYKNQQGCNYYL